MKVPNGTYMLARQYVNGVETDQAGSLFSNRTVISNGVFGDEDNTFVFKQNGVLGIGVDGQDPVDRGHWSNQNGKIVVTVEAMGTKIQAELVKI